MAQSDLRLTGVRRAQNETARLRGGPHVRQSRGTFDLGSSNLPRKPALSSSRKWSFSATAELCRPAYHPCDGPYRPKGNACLLLTCHSWSRTRRGLVGGTPAAHSRHRASLDLTVCRVTSGTSSSRLWPRSATVML